MVFDREVRGRGARRWRLVLDDHPEPLGHRSVLRAYDGRAEAGLLCFFLVEVGVAKTIQVADLQVGEQYRRRGLATLLWEQMESYVAARYGPCLVDHGGLTADGKLWFARYRAGHADSAHSYFPARA